MLVCLAALYNSLSFSKDQQLAAGVEDQTQKGCPQCSLVLMIQDEFYPIPSNKNGLSHIQEKSKACVYGLSQK